MTYSTGDYCAQHEAPAWKDKADFICLARIDETPRWEQLWVKREGSGLYLVCCIPFFLYDLALGDSVALDESNIVKGIVKRGGNVTFRVWFGKSSRTDRDRVAARLATEPCVLEWSSDDLLALSSDQAVARAVADYLQEEESDGSLAYETGRT